MHRKCLCWGVRGHKRYYKSGKVVYVKPYKKGIDREKIPIESKSYYLASSSELRTHQININMIDEVLNNGFGEKEEKDLNKERRPSLKMRLLKKKEQVGNDKRPEKEKKTERSYPE